MNSYRDFASSAVRQLAGSSAEHALLSPLVHFSWFADNDAYLNALDVEHVSRSKGRSVTAPVVVLVSDERLTKGDDSGFSERWSKSASPRLAMARQATEGIQIVRVTSLSDAAAYLTEAQTASVRVARVFVQVKWGVFFRRNEQERATLFPELFQLYDLSPGTGSTLGIFCQKSDIAAVKATESSTVVHPVLRGTIEPWAIRRYSLLCTRNTAQP